MREETAKELRAALAARPIHLGPITDLTARARAEELLEQHDRQVAAAAEQPSPYARVNAMGHREYEGRVLVLGHIYRVHDLSINADHEVVERVVDISDRAIHSIEWVAAEVYAAWRADLERTAATRLNISRTAGHPEASAYRDDEDDDQEGDDDFAESIDDMAITDRPLTTTSSPTRPTVERLDYTAPPPGADPAVSLDVAWTAYKSSNKPPQLRIGFDMGCFCFGWIVDDRPRPIMRGHYDVREQAIAAAWTWYDRRLALSTRLAALGVADRATNRIEQAFWPVCLIWSDDQVAEVKHWLQDSTAELPEVLRG